ERACLEKEGKQLTQQRAERRRCRATGHEWDADQERRDRRARLAPAEKRAVVEEADDAAADEDERHLGLYRDRDHKRSGGECPLEPIFHPELRQPVARME